MIVAQRSVQSQSTLEMERDFPANLRDTRTGFWEPLRRRTISSSLSRSWVTSSAAMQARLSRLVSI